MKRLWPLLLLLPLLVLSAGIVRNELMLGGATEWQIPITGYDPRDMLRGQYIRFTYDWAASRPPSVEGEMQGCLTGTPPDGAPFELQPLGTPCAHPILGLEVRGGGRRAPVFPARLFVDERVAASLDEQLRQPDADMVVVAKLTSGGRLANLRIEPAKAEETVR